MESGVITKGRKMSTPAEVLELAGDHMADPLVCMLVRKKKSQNRVGFWLSSIEDIFRKRVTFQDNQ